VVFSFAIGRYLFPYNADPSRPLPLSLPLSKGRDGVGSEGMSIDSLIAAWSTEKQIGILEAAGMQRAPSIPDARFGFFPNEVRGLADHVDSLFHVPAPVVLAQYALESRFGLSDLGANNFFGHKFAVAQRWALPPARYAMALTKEYEEGEWRTIRTKFARYRSAQECFEVHGRFLNRSPLYGEALKHKEDPIRYAREIGRRYATDPDYALKLIVIMKRYELL